MERFKYVSHINFGSCCRHALVGALNLCHAELLLLLRNERRQYLRYDTERSGAVRSGAERYGAERSGTERKTAKQVEIHTQYVRYTYAIRTVYARNTYAKKG